MAHAAELAAWEGSLELFRLLANSVPAMIAYYDAPENGQRCRFANRAYAAAFGLTEATIIGKSFPEVIGEEAAREVQPSIDEVVQHSRTVAYVRELKAADGSRRWIEVNVLPHLGAHGKPLGAFVIVTDITQHQLATQALRASEERLTKFMQASAEGIAFHKDGVITDANPPLCALVGYSLDELRGRSALDFIAPDQVARVVAVLGADEELGYESVILHKNGTRIPVEFIGRTLVYENERLRMSVVRDLRDRHAAQARIHHLAHHDPLTGLPNRLSFMERLSAQLELARVSGAQLALLFIDLDHFKRVNDSLGHLVGDTLLQTVAARISGCLRASDLVARFGGDEFMVLLPDASRDDVAEVALKLLNAVEVPIDAEGRAISVTPSVGIAMFPSDGDTPTELIKHADTAMYIAKARGRANYQFFDPAVASAAYAALVLESQLAQALERNEFVLHFQPQVRAADGSLAGVEALIRWQHPERGLLGPNEFIPLAEQRRLMLPIGQWVLRSAARAARRWRARGLIDVPVAVNLSSMQFHAEGFVEAVEQVLREEQVPGDWLELELTERMLMDDLGAVKRTLQRLKAMGIRISVDDFGTGYSSLAHLKELPIDGMKIDRSFVQDLPRERGSTAIARAVMQMAQGLEITVIAEGVENDEQRRFLAAEGCDVLQGELISVPLTAAELAAWVAERARLLGTVRTF
ncbi:MAG: EAL domain-containing protein [Betaproteobacteria bacterium]|nr:MAG: EAL domain-containing protein [Betaproteobacteria bacterium]